MRSQINMLIPSSRISPITLYVGTILLRFAPGNGRLRGY